MDLEFYNLYNTLGYYKKGLFKILEEIDECLKQAMGTYDNTYSRLPISTKYNISLTMIGVLQVYLNMFYMGESLLEEVRSKLAEFERNCQPEHDNETQPSRVKSTFFQLNKDAETTSEIKREYVEAPSCSKDAFFQLNKESEAVTEIQDKYVNVPSCSGETQFQLNEETEIKNEFVEAPSCSKDAFFQLDKESEAVTEIQDKYVNVPSCSVETQFQLNNETEIKNEFVEVLSCSGESLDGGTASSIIEGETDTETIVNLDQPVCENIETDEVAPPDLDDDKLEPSIDVEVTNEVNVIDAEDAIIEEPPIEQITPKLEEVIKDESKLSINEVPAEPINDEISNGDLNTAVAAWIEKSKEAKAEPHYSAIEKILKMNIRDRRREAEKKYERQILPPDFKFTAVSKPVSPAKTPSVKKKTKQNPCYEIFDDTLKVNQSCIFCYISSPGEFYVRTNQQLFQTVETFINDDLNTFHKVVISKYKSKEEAKRIVGNFGFAYLTSKRKWFRVQVLDWMDEEEIEKILVQLVDYGEKYYCNYTNLKCMIELYSKFPKMAIKCHLAGIYSPNTQDPQKWPLESINRLIELSEMKNSTRFVPIYVHKEGDSYGVDLFRENSDDRPLGEILVDDGLACQIKIVEDTHLDTISEENEDLVEFDNINEAITGYDAQDEARICPFTDGTGKCFKGPSCKLEHAELSPDGITTDKALIVYQAFNKLALPEVNEKFNILITGYIDTCHFYGQIIRDKHNSSPFNKDFQNLINVMKSNDLVQTYVPFKILPGIGEIVITKHSNEWYRASCVGHGPEPDMVKLFLVDFGVSIVKKLSEIRQVKEDFLHVPLQAVEFIIYNCQQKLDVSSEEVEKFFLECMNFKQFTAYIIDSTEPLWVRLWDSNDFDMAWVLKECGIAEDRTRDCTPDKCCLIKL